MWNYIKFLGGLLWAAIVLAPIILAAAAIVVEVQTPQSTISAPMMAFAGGYLLCVNLIPINFLPFGDILFRKVANWCAAVAGLITGIFWILDAEMATVSTQHPENLSPITNWATLKSLAIAMMIATFFSIMIMVALAPIIRAIVKNGGKH